MQRVPPSITEQRASIGLTTPTPEERAFIWSQLSIPQANVHKEAGGLKFHPLVKRLHDGPWRFVCEGGGLRGGKSLGLSGEVIAWLPHSNLIWLAAENYDTTRQEMEYIAEAAASLGWASSISLPKKRYDPASIETTWGCRVETRSLHDLGAMNASSALTSRAPDFIGICEPGLAPPESLQQSRERLTTRRGRLWMAGTFEKSNTWFVETWKKWTRWPNPDMGKSLAVPSWLNIASFPGGRHDPEIESIMLQYPTFKEFLVRWGGIPMTSEALVMGAYWDEKRLVSDIAQFQPYDRDGHKMPVWLAIDPGYSGKSVYAVEVLQKTSDSHWAVIDEVIGRTLVHESVIDLCRQKPWWNHVTSGIIDPYAGVNHTYGNASPQEIWWRYGKVPLSPSPRLEVEEAVGRLHFVMRDPQTGRSHVTINPQCKRLIWEMAHWKRIQTREGLGKPSDANCDAVKALGYFMSAKYTEEALGYVPGNEPIEVHDWSIGGATPGRSKADRYANRNFGAGDYD